MNFLIKKVGKSGEMWRKMCNFVGKTLKYKDERAGLNSVIS